MIEPQFLKSDGEIYGEICEFLGVKHNCFSNSLKENVKEVCVVRLCKAMGIRCAYNSKNELFNFFSCIMGEVLVQKLGFEVRIDEFNLKFARFENVNLIHSASNMLENIDLDEAFINVFNLAAKFKDKVLT